MATKPNRVKDIEIDEDELLSKAYSNKELLGKTFIVEGIEIVDSQKFDNQYIMAHISGDDIEDGKKWRTGATNIVARLIKANKDELFPLQVTVVAIGNAYDIE